MERAIVGRKQGIMGLIALMMVSAEKRHDMVTIQSTKQQLYQGVSRNTKNPPNQRQKRKRIRQMA